MANDAARAPLQDQLDELLREVNDYRGSVGGRFATLEQRHKDLHGYVGQTIEWQQTLDRKVQGNTRAIEGLAITVGRALDRLDKDDDERKMTKKILFKIAKKLGVT